MKTKIICMLFITVFLCFLCSLTVFATDTEAEVIKDGIYVIKSNINSKKVIDVEINSNNVELWTDINNISQRFEFKYDKEEDCYTIKSILTGKYLDVYGGYSKSGTNVQVWEENGTDGQKWIIEKEKTGYSIISKCNGLYLDVYGGYSSDGTNIQVWPTNSTKGQQFIIEKVEDTVHEKTIEDGIYRINTSLKNSLTINVKKTDGNANIMDFDGTKSQEFEVQYNEEDGYYTLKSLQTKKYLEIADESFYPGTNVDALGEECEDLQKWEIRENPNQTFSLISKYNGLFMDVFGGYTKAGTNIQVWQSNSTKGQQFLFEEVITKGTKIIEDGTYKIELSANTKKALDVSKNNVILWENEKKATQQFEFKYLEDEGCYTIKSTATEKYLDVYGGYTKPGTNVQVWNSNGTDGQKWIIKKQGNDFFIISKCNGLYLDIYGGYTKAGTNVQMWRYNGGIAQRFSIKEIAEDEQVSIAEGIYKIHLASDYNKVIEVNNASIKSEANIQVGESSNSKNQYFKIIFNDNGSCQLQALHSGKVLDIYKGLSTPGTNVQQYTSNGGNWQKWKIVKEGEAFSIISECGNMYLDIYGGYTAVGTNVQIWYNNGTIGQRFILEEISEDIPVVSEGKYRIRTAVSKNMALDIYADSKVNGANVQIYNSSNVLNQRFKLDYLGKSIYRITNISSGKVLEVQDGKNKPETNVCQNDWKNTDYQKWKIIEAGDGFYYVVSVCNGLYLDVYGGYSSNETNVQVYPGHGGNSQKFAFDSVIFGIDISYYQGDIDFNQVNASGKADFIIARAGYGRNASQKDSKFEEYYAQAKRLKIPVGSYLYSYASDVEGAYAEAYNVLNWLNGKSFELPIFYDLEDKAQDGLDASTITQMAKAFGETLKSHGYRVGVYASKNWLKYRMNVNEIPEDYSIWVAAYGSATTGNNGFLPEEVYEYYGEHDIWQYSSRGIVEGISGYVDVNIAYKNHLR